MEHSIHCDVVIIDADVQYQAWAGVCYLTPLIGGLVADKYLGRYWTIMLFCAIYAVGLALVVVFSAPGAINDGMFFLFSPGDRIKKYVVEIMYFQDDR